MRKQPLIALVAFVVLATSTFVGAAGAGTFNPVPTRATAHYAAAGRGSLVSAERTRSAAHARYVRAVAKFEALLASERVQANWRAAGADRMAVHSSAFRPGAPLPSEWFRFLAVAAKQQAAARAAYLAAVAETQAQAVTAQATTAQDQTVPAPAATPAPVATQAAAPASGGNSGGPWLELRTCESGDNYAEDSGNGYYGAYQFSLGTWQALGYAGYPNEASPATQDAAAEHLQAVSGWGQWPSCSAELGL